MVNSFGPGNQENPKRAANGVGAYNGKKKKKPTNTFNTPTGGTPAANPMGGAQMDFDMPDMSGMGGMQMNAPNPMGSGNTPAYQDWMQDLQQSGAPEPTMADIPPVRSPERPMRAIDSRRMLSGIAGMSSMGAQPAGMAGIVPGDMPDSGPYQPIDFPTDGDGRKMLMPVPGRDKHQPLSGWPERPFGDPTSPFPRPGEPGHWGSASDPATGDEEIIYGMGGGQSPQVAGWDDPAMGGFQMDDPMMDDMQMGQPDMGDPFMGDPFMGQQGQEPPQGQQPPPRKPSQGVDPDRWAEKQDAYTKWMEEMTGPATEMQKDIYAEELELQDEIEGVNVVKPWETGDIQQDIIDSAADKRKRSRNSFAGGQAPAGGDALGDALSGGSQAGSSVAPPVSAVGEPAVEPAVAPAVSRPPTGQPDWKGDDTPEPVKPEIAGMPMDSDLEAEWREKNPNEPLPELDDTPEPVKPKFQPSWEGWGSLGPDRKEKLYEKYGKDRVEEYVKENNGNIPPFDEWDKEGQDKPALEEFKDKVDAGEVSDEEPIGIPPKEPVSEGAMMDERNWDTVDGEYKFMGADYHKQNTRPETDTKDWEETREEAAEDIKEGDKFSEVGDAAYGTAASESRSAANEAAEPFNPDDWMMGGLRSDPSSHMRNKVTDERITQDEYQRLMSGSSAGGTAPIVSLPPTQPPPVEEPSADADYYDKLVNPGKFQNPAISLPPTYGKGEGPGSQGLGGTFQPVGEYDAEIPELYDEYGNIHTGPNPIVVEEEEDEGALGIRRRAESPAQMRIRRNNLVADEYEKMNQGLGGMTSARPGMSSDIGSYAQQQLGPEVAARMAAGQVQLDVPFQYDMQHADQVRKRRQEKHAEGLAQAGMIRDDYYDHLNDLIKSGATNNEIMQWAAAQQAPAFG